MPVIALATSVFRQYRAHHALVDAGSAGLELHPHGAGQGPAGAWQVIFGHALRLALLPVVFYLGPVFVGMVTGSVVIDLYFSTGGIG